MNGYSFGSDNAILLYYLVQQHLGAVRFEEPASDRRPDRVKPRQQALPGSVYRYMLRVLKRFLGVGNLPTPHPEAG